MKVRTTCLLLALGAALFALGVLASVHSPYSPEESCVYGVWGGSSHDDVLRIQFARDGTCIMSIREGTTDQVRILEGEFQMDRSKKPIPLTIRNISKLSHPLHTIVQFSGSESMRLSAFAPHWRLRPISFDRNSSVKLKRIDKAAFHMSRGQ